MGDQKLSLTGEQRDLPIETHGLLTTSSLLPILMQRGIPVYHRAINYHTAKEYTIADKPYIFTSPVTFTPYASAKPCSARCWFCSENLRIEKTHGSGALLRPKLHYQDQLAEVLKQLKPIPLGLSLSGLEITDDPEWLLATLDTLEAWQQSGGQWLEKAAYTNAAGMINAGVIDALAKFELDRVEVSRHHFSESSNQSIMNFRPDQSIQSQAVFERCLKQMNENLPVTLVCLLQLQGVYTDEAVLHYINWANSLGVKKVIFRELCEVPRYYQASKTFKKIPLYRQSIEQLVHQWLNGSQATVNSFTNGYYFWNAEFKFNDMNVVFERSDYGLMNQAHGSDIIHKLVFFANGHLCAGWEPTKRVLYSVS